jgi:glycosyltransferase involved in cell wall biosynthesis
MSISIGSVICSRNDAVYLRNLIPYLAEEQIDVILIDNNSNDGTKDEFTAKNYPNIIERRDLAFDGRFDLSRQLAAKAIAFDELCSEWVIHQDADEVLHAPGNWGGLRESIQEAHAQGFTILNFNELVMLPFDPKIDDYMSNNRRFYFFEPRPLRLMRAWRRSANLTNVATGGHILTGENVYVSPKRMILKHFMVRSQSHAIQKYIGRAFADGDLAKGWHQNRVNLTTEMLKIPESSEFLHTLETPQASPAKLPRSAKAHFWEW